jgi:hypothetical protein
MTKIHVVHILVVPNSAATALRSSAVTAVCKALLLFFGTTHTMLKNAECSYCSSAVLLLRAAQHKWHTYGVARMRAPERE